jgi:hypothetical protein
VAVDANGNAFITGYYAQNASFGQTSPGETSVATAGGYNLFVAKYNSAGLLGWVRTPLAADDIYGSGIAVDPGGNVVVVGSYYQDSATSDLFVAKFGPDGSLLWVQAEGGLDDDQGTKAAVDSNGNIFITGFFTGDAYFGTDNLVYGNDATEMFVAKYDADGALMWVEASFSNEAQGSDIAVDSAGNCLVTGYFRDYADFGTHELYSDGFFDLFLAKYSPDGDALWAANTETEVGINATGIALDETDNVYLTGSFAGDVSFGKTTLTNDYIFNQFVAGYDSSGNVLFARSVGTQGELTGYAIAVDSGGSLIVVGQLKERALVGSDELLSSGDSDVFVAKLLVSEDGGEKVGFTSFRRLQDGSFQLEFKLDACSGWRLQTSTDLVSWSTLQTYDVQSGFRIFIDQDARNFPQRFYRLATP